MIPFHPQTSPSLLCMENITAVEETNVKGYCCIKVSTHVKDNRDHLLRAEVSYYMESSISRVL